MKTLAISLGLAQVILFICAIVGVITPPIIILFLPTFILIVGAILLEIVSVTIGIYNDMIDDEEAISFEDKDIYDENQD